MAETALPQPADDQKASNNAPPVPESIDGSLLGKYYSRLSIGQYKRPSPFTVSEYKVDTIINLPLPTELSDSTTVGYASAEFESVGDVANGDLGGAAESFALRSATSFAADAAGFVAKRILGDTLAGKVVTGAMAAAGSKIIPSALQQAAGVAPNPNPTVVFQGSSLRDFSLTWMFSPKDPKESANLQRVIKLLKAAALPENTSSNSGAILNYPRIVQLNFFPWDMQSIVSDINNQWGWTENSIIKIKKCMMQSVNVNYAPSNVPAFFKEDATTGTKYRPVAVSISINFKEIEYMLSGDWGGKFADTTLLGEIDQAIEGATSTMGNIGSQPVAAR
jgi:hypothetical protein